MEQDWKGMDGAIAFHLIDRHAEDWAHAGKMMREWREANESDDLETLRQRVQELEKDCDEYHQVAMNHIHANEKLTAERDALKKQRDALVEAATMAVEMIEYDKHERRHVRWKLLDAIASVKEKQNDSD